MSFVTALALAIGVLAVGPFIAHRLRRQKLDVRPFPAVRLVPEGAAQARRRSRLEDRSLFAVRVLVVLLLALLGAGLERRASSLAVARVHGSQVGIVLVLDDSLSMSATQRGGGTRFLRAVASAKEIVSNLSDGDSVALVLAGSPARVAVAATTSPAEVARALERVQSTFRSTDLESALSIADRIAESMAQPDRRIALLSDLADGHPDSPALGTDLRAPLWVPLPDLPGTASDCAVITAARDRDQVRAHVACSPYAAPQERTLSLINADGDVVSRVTLPPSRGGDATLSASGVAAHATLRVRLSEGDAIPIDDTLEVRASPIAMTIAFIGNQTDTPGSPSEHALANAGLVALESEVSLRPLASLPDNEADLRPFQAIIHDNPHGYTPEQRRALDAYLSQGAEALLSLGPEAESAPLGQSFDPFLHDPVGWSRNAFDSAGGEFASAAFAPFVSSLQELHAKGRATLSREDGSSFERLLGWADGAPLVAKKRWGKGALWVSSLPLSSDVSDLPFRPGFLSVLDAFLEDVRRVSAVQVVAAGATWSFTGTPPAVRCPSGNPCRSPSGAAGVIELDQAGIYSAKVDGRDEERIVKTAEQELDLRPRALAKPGESGHGTGDDAKVSESRTVAFLLLAAVCGELVLRAFAFGKSRRGSAL